MSAKQQRLLDVWLVDLNEVYAAVPFTVVADWLQQGRLLPADKVRLRGNQKWHAIEAVPALAPYLPRAEPTAAHDQAEALQPVDLDVGWGRRHDEEDEDVDMIPLIDISLVLLIFFMMTATVSSGVFSTINTPAAQHQLQTLTQGSYWVGVDVRSRSGTVEKGENGRPLPWYSFGKDDEELLAPTLQVEEVLGALGKEVQSYQGEVKVRLKAERSLPIETVKDTTLRLQGLESQINRERGKSAPRVAFEILGEVSEPQTK